MDAIFTGNQISERRKALGLTQRELAEQLHVTDKAVSKWERGINFPDLGLMEPLAAVLDTSPAVLLGLENADQDEIVSSITQISNEQLEDAQREMKRIGWFCIGAAALLTLAYTLFGKDVKRTQNAYLILHCVILFIVIGGVYLLVKYGEIRKFRTMDVLILYIALLSVLIILAIQFFTGYSPNTVLALCLATISAGSFQLLFYQIMASRFAKAIPLILCTAFTAWQLWLGYFSSNFAAPAICCFVVWLVCRIKKVQ